jgi:hypothetical protein
MSDKDEQDWLDLLAGQSVPDADPNTVRDAQIFRGALLAHTERLENDAEIPYPHILANVLSRLETKEIRKTPKPASWISTLFQTLKDVFASLVPPPINRPIPAMAFAFVLVVSFVTYIVWPPKQIDTTVAPHKIAQQGITNTTYQTIYAQKTDEMADDLRGLSVRWEGEGGNVFAFSPITPPSEAAKAFGAGLLTGREALLGKSEVALPTLLLPPATEDTWLKTQWADDFELGRWTVLLWTASRFHRDLPPTFWDEQRWIFSQLKAAFVARAETDNTKKVLFQLENKIEPHLKRLPTENNPKIYKDLGFNLKTMMSFLAPKPAD